MTVCAHQVLQSGWELLKIERITHFVELYQLARASNRYCAIKIHTLVGHPLV